MKFIISGKNIDVTAGLKAAVEDKIGKLEKYFTPETEVHATLSVEKERQKIEVTIPIKGNIIASYPITGTGTKASYKWETTETGTEPIKFTIPYEEDADLNHQATERKKWYYVPPLGDSNKPQGAYIISATIDRKKSTATIPAEYMQWKAGYQYTYIFKITEAGPNIAFTNMQVEKWVETPIKNNGGTEDW